MATEKIIKIHTAAKLLNRSTKSLRNYIKSGKLKSKKINGKKGPEYVFAQSELENFAENFLKINLTFKEQALKSELKGKSPGKIGQELITQDAIDFTKFTEILIQTENEKMQIIEEFGEYKARLAYKVGQLEAEVKTLDNLKKEKEKMEKKLEESEYLFKVRDEDAKQLLKMKVFYDQKQWWHFWKGKYRFYDSEDMLKKQNSQD